MATTTKQPDETELLLPDIRLPNRYEKFKALMPVAMPGAEIALQVIRPVFARVVAQTHFGEIDRDKLLTALLILYSGEPPSPEVDALLPAGMPSHIDAAELVVMGCKKAGDDQ